MRSVTAIKKDWRFMYCTFTLIMIKVMVSQDLTKRSLSSKSHIIVKTILTLPTVTSYSLLVLSKLCIRFYCVIMLEF